MPSDKRQDDRKQEDRKQEEAVRDSFPASDPPANSGIVGPGGPDAPEEEARSTPPGKDKAHPSPRK